MGGSSLLNHCFLSPVGSTVTLVLVGKERHPPPRKMIWRAKDSEHDSEPFYGSETSRRFRILKEQIQLGGRQLRRKENWFYIFVQKEKKMN